MNEVGLQGIAETEAGARQCPRECSEHHTFEPPCALAVRPDYIPGIDVQGLCPGCGQRSLFLAAGGYVTCRSRRARQTAIRSPTASPHGAGTHRGERVTDAQRQDRRVCVCGHARGHHSRSRKAKCLWTGCGCPLYLLDTLRRPA